MESSRSCRTSSRVRSVQPVRPAVITPPKSVQPGLVAEYLLPAEIQTAISVGKRVAGTWRLWHRPMRTRSSWRSGNTASFDGALRTFAGCGLALRAKIAPWSGNAKGRKRHRVLALGVHRRGDIIPQLERPRYQPRYRGTGDDVPAQAPFVSHGRV